MLEDYDHRHGLVHSGRILSKRYDAKQFLIHIDETRFDQTFFELAESDHHITLSVSTHQRGSFESSKVHDSELTSRYSFADILSLLGPPLGAVIVNHLRMADVKGNANAHSLALATLKVKTSPVLQMDSRQSRSIYMSSKAIEQRTLRKPSTWYESCSPGRSVSKL